MLQNHNIASAFAYSTQPCLVLSREKSPLIVAANKALQTWLGYAQEELLNKVFFNASDKFMAALGVDELELSEIFEQAIATKSAVKRNIKYSVTASAETSSKQNGGFYEIFPIETKAGISYLAIQIILHTLDTSAAPQAHKSAASTKSVVSGSAPNQSLELLIDSLTNVIFTLDVEPTGLYRFSFVNRAFQVTTGLPVEKVIGKYVHEIIPEPSLSMVLEKYKEAIEKKQQVSWQEVSQYPTGQKIAEVLVVPVLNAKGECFQLAGLVHDITPFKEAEARQVRLTQDLYQQNRDLQQFTYIISHNLRAPLANALGLVRHLPNVAPETNLFQQYVAHLKTSIENLDKILEDLNLILSVRDRQDQLHKEHVFVGEVCWQAAQALEVELKHAAGQLEINIDPEFKVQANRAYVYSICYNLLSNAIKYRSKERLLKIKVTSDSTSEDGPAIHFTDNGSGIDLQKAGDDIFKLYTRFHSHVEGRGMGLFLVKTHIEALGGYIKVKSTPGQGTTFSVFFKELVS